jgi:hypothetical protein
MVMRQVTSKLETIVLLRVSSSTEVTASVT